jgi:hypothetical protein
VQVWWVAELKKYANLKKTHIFTPLLGRKKSGVDSSLTTKSLEIFSCDIWGDRNRVATCWGNAALELGSAATFLQLLTWSLKRAASPLKITVLERACSFTIFLSIQKFSIFQKNPHDRSGASYEAIETAGRVVAAFWRPQCPDLVIFGDSGQNPPGAKIMQNQRFSVPKRRETARRGAVSTLQCCGVLMQSIERCYRSMAASQIVKLVLAGRFGLSKHAQ